MAGARRLRAADFAPAKLFSTFFSKLHGGKKIGIQPDKPRQNCYLFGLPVWANVLSMFISCLSVFFLG